MKRKNRHDVTMAAAVDWPAAVFANLYANSASVKPGWLVLMAEMRTGCDF